MLRICVSVISKWEDRGKEIVLRRNISGIALRRRNRIIIVTSIYKVGGGQPRLRNWVLVLCVPSHEIGSWEPELPRKSGMGVLGSLSSLGGGCEPHAELVHHARTQAVLRAERHAHGSTLKMQMKTRS